MVTDNENMTSFSDEQHAKAFSPISWRDTGKVILFNEAQPKKASLFISFNDDESEISSRDEQHLNAFDKN